MIATKPAEGSFGTPIAVSPSAVYSQPKIAVAPNGAITVAWMSMDGAVSAVSRPRGGPFGPIEEIAPPNPDVGDYYYSASLRLASTDDTTVAIWLSRNGDTAYLQAATRLNGGDFSEPVNLSPLAQVERRQASEPELALADDGMATVVWDQTEPNGSSILASTQPSGGSFGNPVRVGAGFSSPQIAVSKSGETLVAWASQRVIGSPTVLVASRPSKGDFSLPRVYTSNKAIGSYAAGFYYVAGVAFGDDGTATVAALLYQPGSDETSPQTMTRDPGQKFTRLTELPASEGLGLSQLSVAADGTTNVMLSRYSDYDGKVLASTRLPGGSFSKPVVLEDSSSSSGVVATGSSGLATAAWTIGGLGKYDSPEVITASTTPDREFCGRASLSLGRFTVNRKTGVGRLGVVTGTQGSLVLKRTGAVTGWRSDAQSPGRTTATIKARGKALRKLRKRGKTKVRVVVRFSPGFDCRPTTKSKVVRLVKGRR